MSPYLSAYPNRKEVVISALADGKSVGRIPISKALRDKEAPKTSKLRELAAERLTDYSDKDIVKGRSLISSGPDFRAVIDKIPNSTVDTRSAFRSDTEPRLGFWLAYGFGIHGTKLSPGVAKVLRRRICGEDSGIDDAAFEIPKRYHSKPSDIWRPVRD